MDTHNYFMEKALVLAQDALDRNEFPVGCVIVHNGEVISEGHRCNSGTCMNEIDHAEILALRRLMSADKKPDLGEVTVYSTMEPCLMCFSTLIVNGITKIVYGYEDAMGGGTSLPLENLAPLYRDLQLEITGGVLRHRCLEQFKTFFSRDESPYLKDSYLAKYTLNQ